MSGYPRSRATKLKAVRRFFEIGSTAFVAEEFGVTAATLRDWVKEYKQTGDVHEPMNTILKFGRPQITHRAFKKQSICAWVEPQLAEFLKDEASKRNIQVSHLLRNIILAIYKQQKAEAKDNDSGK